MPDEHLVGVVQVALGHEEFLLLVGQGSSVRIVVVTGDAHADVSPCRIMGATTGVSRVRGTLRHFSSLPVSYRSIGSCLTRHRTELSARS